MKRVTIVYLAVATIVTAAAVAYVRWQNTVR